LILANSAGVSWAGAARHPARQRMRAGINGFRFIWLRVAGYGLRVTGFELRVAGYSARAFPPGYRGARGVFLVTGHWSLVTGHASRVTRHASRVTRHGLNVISKDPIFLFLAQRPPSTKTVSPLPLWYFLPVLSHIMLILWPL